MTKPSLLIVDDHEHILRQLTWALAEDFDVHTATNPTEAIDKLRAVHPSLLTVDLTLSKGGEQKREGFDVLSAALRADPIMKAIVITSEQEENTAIRALSLGAFDYFVKPLPLDELRVALKRASYLSELDRRASAPLGDADDSLGLIGESEPMRALKHLLRRVAETSFTALILGESGVGKELVARGIWQLSSRRDSPFVVVNCAAIPEGLLESELFGHEKGSFTGAHALKKGKFEEADGGTVFLDEIGDLSPALQVKLLRFLQERTIERVGGNRPIQVDVRILSATNRDLEEEIEANRFREDLYYRLNVLRVCVPPLRERGDDVLRLATHFRDCLVRDQGMTRKTFSRDAELALMGYHWPGNVRELENVVKSAVVRSMQSQIGARHLDLKRSMRDTHDLKAARDQLEKLLVGRALARNNGVVSRAARDLSISRVTLYDLLEKHGMRSAVAGAARRATRGGAVVSEAGWGPGCEKEFAGD